MAQFSRIQRGSSIILGTSATVDVPISTVDPSKCLVFYSSRPIVNIGGFNWQEIAGIYHTFPNSTTLRFGRITNLDNFSTEIPIYIEYQIVEFSSGVKVQRASDFTTEYGATTISFTSAVDINKSWVRVYENASAPNWDYNGYDQCIYKLKNTSAFDVYNWVDVNNYTTRYFWEVVEYDNCKVQYLSANLPSGYGTSTSGLIGTLTSAVDPSKTFIFGNTLLRVAGSSLTYYPNLKLSGTDKVIWTRTSAESVTASTDMCVYIVEFTDAKVYQHNAIMTTVSAFTANISSDGFDYNKSISFLNTNLNKIPNGAASVLNFKDHLITHKLLSDGTFSASRGASTQNIAFDYQILEFTSSSSSGSSGTSASLYPFINYFSATNNIYCQSGETIDLNFDIDNYDSYVIYKDYPNNMVSTLQQTPEFIVSGWFNAQASSADYLISSTNLKIPNVTLSGGYNKLAIIFYSNESNNATSANMVSASFNGLAFQRSSIGYVISAATQLAEIWSLPINNTIPISGITSDLDFGIRAYNLNTGSFIILATLSGMKQENAETSAGYGYNVSDVESSGLQQSATKDSIIFQVLCDTTAIRVYNGADGQTTHWQILGYTSAGTGVTNINVLSKIASADGLTDVDWVRVGTSNRMALTQASFKAEYTDVNLITSGTIYSASYNSNLVSAATSGLTSGTLSAVNIPSGKGRVLIFGYGCEGNSSTTIRVTSANYGGYQLTRAVQISGVNSNYQDVEIWYLLCEDKFPSSGYTGNLNYYIQSANISTGLVAAAFTISGAKQKAPEYSATFFYTNTSAISASTISASKGSIIIEVESNSNKLDNSSSFATALNNQIKIFDVGSYNIQTTMMAYKIASADALYTSNWQFDPSLLGRVAHGLVSFEADGFVSTPVVSGSNYYYLSAFNSSGSTYNGLYIVINYYPVINSFNGIPPIITNGQSSNLLWSISTPDCWCSANFSATTSTSSSTSAWSSIDREYRTLIEINNSSLSGSSTGFPLYFNLRNLSANSTFWSNVGTSGGDLIVTTSGGTQLPLEVVWISATTSAGEIYFKTDDQLSATNKFYLYWGKIGATQPDITATYGRNAVWNNGYKRVMHFENGINGTASLVDSTGNVSALVPNVNSTYMADSPIQGQAFSATTNNWAPAYQTTGIKTSDLSAAATIECLIKHASTFATGATERKHIISHSIGNDWAFFFDTNGQLWFEQDNTVGGWTVLNTTKASWTGGEWYDIGFTLVSTASNAHTGIFYVSGVQESTENSTEQWLSLSNNYAIGNHGADGTVYLDNMAIAELRVSNVVRSSGWLKTSYNMKYTNRNFWITSATTETRTTSSSTTSGIGFLSYSACNSFFRIYNNATSALVTSAKSYIYDRKYKLKLTLDKNSVFTQEVDYPLTFNLANISATSLNYLLDSFWSNVQQDGGDLIVTDISGNRLPLDVEFINIFNKTGTIHFKNTNTLKTSADSSDNEFYLYWGNTGTSVSQPNASAIYGSQNVWNSNYVGVWHFNETIGSTIYDKTSYGNNGTFTGFISSVNSPIGLGFDITSARYVTIPSATQYNTSAITVEFIVKTSYNGTNYPYIVAQDNGTSRKFDATIYQGGLGWFGHNNNWAIENVANANSNNTWYGFGGRAQLNTSASLLINTSSVGTDTSISAMSGSNASISIGGNWIDAEFVIDELRYSNIMRSEEWVKTTNNILINNSSVWSLGVPELVNLSGSISVSPTTNTQYNIEIINCCGSASNNFLISVTSVSGDTYYFRGVWEGVGRGIITGIY